MAHTITQRLQTALINIAEDPVSGIKEKLEAVRYLLEIKHSRRCELEEPKGKSKPLTNAFLGSAKP